MTAWSSRPSNPGRPARRPPSWLGCSWSPPASPPRRRPQHSLSARGRVCSAPRHMEQAPLRRARPARQTRRTRRTRRRGLPAWRGGRTPRGRLTVARTRSRRRSCSEKIQIPLGHRPDEDAGERRADPEGPDLWAEGDRRSGPKRGVLHVVTMHGDKVEEAEGTDALRSARAREQGKTCWIDLRSPNPGQIAAVTEALGLHPLIAEDILEGNQRPKIEVTDNLVHIVMFA